MTCTVRRLFFLAMLLVVVGCQDSATGDAKAGSPVRTADGASRLALARQGDGLVLVAVDFEDESYEVLTRPISDWFRTVEGYVLDRPAQLWASRDHSRAVMFGYRHDGSGREVNVLRAGKWQKLCTFESLRHVVVAPSARLIVTNHSARGELFTEGTLRVFDYDGNELLAVQSRQGLSSVAVAPDGSWVLVEDEGDAVIVHQDGRKVRFKPDLGTAGETDFGWGVSAVFAGHIVFHGFAEQSPGHVIYPRVAHKVDGTKVPSELTDYERLRDRFVLTPDRQLYVVGAEGFVQVSKLASDFDAENHTFIVSSAGLTLASSRSDLSWLDVNGNATASYAPESVPEFNRVTIEKTVVRSVRAGLSLVSHSNDMVYTDEPTSTLDAFTLDAGVVKGERVVALPVESRTLELGTKPDSSWVAWAANSIELSDDFAGAYNMETRQHAALDDLPKIETWADYGESAAYQP